MSHWRATSQGVVSYRNSTSNHNSRAYPNSLMSLYLIEILHQTTTMYDFYMKDMELYLIEILHQTTTMYDFYMKDMELYLIEILHQTTTPFEGFCPLSELYLIEILHQTTTGPLRQV